MYTVIWCSAGVAKDTVKCLYYTGKWACCIFKRYKPRPPYPSLFGLSSGWQLRLSHYVYWGNSVGLTHKVLKYIEYRSVSGVFRTIDSPPPLHPASVSSTRTKGGGGVGYTLAWRWGGGGSIFRKTPDIGLASYSIMLLWINHSLSALHFDHGLNRCCSILHRNPTTKGANSWDWIVKILALMSNSNPNYELGLLGRYLVCFIKCIKSYPLRWTSEGFTLTNRITWDLK